MSKVLEVAGRYGRSRVLSAVANLGCSHAIIKGGLRRWSVLCLPMAGLVLVLAGCGSVPTSNIGDPSSLVSKRAQERWEALIQKDVEKAYTFLSEGTRQAMPLAAYKSRIKPGIWRSVEVKSVKCEASVCRVTLSITYDHKMMKNVQTEIHESWLIEDGSAWYVFQG